MFGVSRKQLIKKSLFLLLIAAVFSGAVYICYANGLTSILTDLIKQG